jgi:hypothetical protein
MKHVTMLAVLLILFFALPLAAQQDNDMKAARDPTEVRQALVSAIP